MDVPISAFNVGDNTPEHVTGHKTLLEGLARTIIHQEITEAYDLVDATLNRISIGQDPELVSTLVTAKNKLFAARTMTDGEA